MSGASEFTDTECRENMRAMCHLAPSHSIKPVLDFCFPPQECVVVVSPLYGSVCDSLSFSVSHRWVLSCVSNLWLSESPALHFLLLP